MLSFINLLDRLRGHKKRSPKELAELHGRQKISVAPTPLPVELPPIERAPAKENFFLPDINNEAAFKKYLHKLKNLSGFGRFYSMPSLNWLRIRLDRVNKELLSLNEPHDFDEDFNFKLATKVRKISEDMLEICSYAKTSTKLDEPLRIQLTTLIEDYLASLGVTQKIFRVGDDYTVWADLGMKDSFELIPTTDPLKASTIAKIEMQPHEICFRTENGDIDNLVFGGFCKVYKLKEN